MMPLALVLAATAAAAPLEVRTWSTGTTPSGAALVQGSVDGGAVLRISNPGPGPLTTTLAVFERPPLSTPYWSVRGRVRTEGVSGEAFLELWSTFPDGGSFFSRTIAAQGPMRHLGGTQTWRDFTLPFRSDPGRSAPVTLTVNLVLPGAGTVEVGPLALHQHDSAAGLLATTNAWFTGPQAGLAGGIAGSLLGVLGAAIGWLSSRGRARSFVLAALSSLLAAGLCALAAAAYGAATSQPREVWLSLATLGSVCALVPAMTLRSTAARYRELELRRIEAADA